MFGCCCISRESNWRKRGEKGVSNYWKLKAIDSIQSSAEIGEHERTKLIKTIIDDSGHRKYFCCTKIDLNEY